jgi:aquaporin Z
MDKTLRAYVAELVGTFLLVFFSAGIVCVNALPRAQEHVPLGLTGIALAQGLVLAVLLSATLPVSGGFLNPALVPVLYVFRRFDLPRALGFLGVQLLGAAAAGLCLRLLFTDEVFREGVPHLNLPAFGVAGFDRKLLVTGAGIELALTFLLTFAIFGTILDPRAPRLGGLGAGLALAVAVYFGFPLTGAAVNPARWLGTFLWESPVLVHDLGNELFVYGIGPTAGALLAGVIYWFGIMPVPPGAKLRHDPASEADDLPGSNRLVRAGHEFSA